MKRGWKNFVITCAALGLIGLAVAMAGMALGGNTALVVHMDHDVMVYRPWGSALYQHNGSIDRGLVDNLIRLVRYGEGMDWEEIAGSRNGHVDWDNWTTSWSKNFEKDLADSIEDGIQQGIEGWLGGLEEGMENWASDWDWSSYMDMDDITVNQWFEKGEVTMGPIEKQGLEQITSLDITAISANVKVQQGDACTITIVQKNEKLEIGYQMQQGRLVVKERKVPGLKLELNHLENNEILITLPAQSNLEGILLQTVSGDIQFEPAVTADLARFNTVSGDVEAANLTANRAELQSVSGDLDLKADVSQGVSAHSVSGEIELQGKLEGQLKIDSVSGNVELEIQGVPDHYQYDFSSTSGTIEVGGSRYRRSASKAGSPNQIVVNTISGHAQLEFQK